METLEITLFCIGGVSAVIAGILKLYRIGYSRGYESGRHCGFTQGMYCAAKREHQKKQKFLQRS